MANRRSKATMMVSLLMYAIFSMAAATCVRIISPDTIWGLFTLCVASAVYWLVDYSHERSELEK